VLLHEISIPTLRRNIGNSNRGALSCQEGIPSRIFLLRLRWDPAKVLVLILQGIL